MEKTDLKIWIAIAFVLMAWGLWGVYKIASQYRQPLDLPPSQPAVEEWHWTDYPDKGK